MNFKGDLKESTRSDRRGSDSIGSDNTISQDPKGLSNEEGSELETLIEPDKIWAEFIKRSDGIWKDLKGSDRILGGDPIGSDMT